MERSRDRPISIINERLFIRGGRGFATVPRVDSRFKGIRGGRKLKNRLSFSIVGGMNIVYASVAE